MSREVSVEDKADLEDIGYRVTGYIGSGIFGDVFSGVGTQHAFIEEPIAANEGISNFDRFCPIRQCYVRRISLEGVKCAIKRYDFSPWGDEQVAYNEAKTLKMLNHDNIVKVFEICRVRQHLQTEEDRDEVITDHMYIIMEYMNGTSLRAYIDSWQWTKMSESSALVIIKHIALGLQYMHSMAITHDDLHADNIMSTTNPDNTTVWKILDFGSARIRSPSNPLVFNPGKDLMYFIRHSKEVLDKSWVSDSTKSNIMFVFTMYENNVFNTIEQINGQLLRYLQ